MHRLPFLLFASLPIACRAATIKHIFSGNWCLHIAAAERVLLGYIKPLRGEGCVDVILCYSLLQHNDLSDSNDALESHYAQ